MKKKRILAIIVTYILNIIILRMRESSDADTAAKNRVDGECLRDRICRAGDEAVVIHLTSTSKV